MLTAATVGFLFGFIGSMPVAGPIAILVFGRGLEDRIRSGVYLAIGGAIAESMYAYLAFWGFNELLELYPWVQPASRGAAAVILVALGIRFIVKRKPKDKPDTRIGNKRSFFLGFTITALNPALVATWTAAVTALYSLDVVEFSASQALPFSAGACLGITCWFTLLLLMLHRLRSRFKVETLDRTVRVMGGLLVLLGLGFAVRFAMYLA